MGHDHHFLSRLDRVASAEVELALSLYRDHELIREVLSHAKLADRIGRVAISLDDPTAGPFIIVARDGGFVTCLGRDMSPGQLPIITRSQLDSIALRVQKLRERLQLAVTLTGGELGKLLTRIFTAGPRLTREEVMGITVMQPLLFRQFFALLAECADDIAQTRMTLRHVRKPKAREHELLRLTWDSLWAVGHLTVLVGIDGREHFDSLGERASGMRDALLPVLFEQGVFSTSLRAAWAASKIGKPLVPGLKRRFAESNGFVNLVSSALGLAAIGHGHPRLRAETRKALDVPKLEEVNKRAAGVNLIRQVMRDWTERSFDPEHDAEALALTLGRIIATTWLKPSASDSPYRFERPEDVPDEIARAFAAWHWGGSGDESRECQLLFLLLPWLVKQQPEDLFLPAELMEHVRFPPVPQMTLEILQRPFNASWIRAPMPIRVPPTPGRNEPCLCGSGKKHKRCCGAS